MEPLCVWIEYLIDHLNKFSNNPYMECAIAVSWLDHADRNLRDALKSALVSTAEGNEIVFSSHRNNLRKRVGPFERVAVHVFLY